MGGARQSADSARAAVGDALAKGRRRTAILPRGAARPDGDAARRRQRGRQRADGREAEVARRAGAVRHRRGAAGDAPGRAGDRHGREGAEGGQGGRRIPSTSRGPKPPPSALAVTKTGFGPGSVAAEEAGAADRSRCRRSQPARQGGGQGAPSRSAAARGARTDRGARDRRWRRRRPQAPPPLSADQLLQPPVGADRCAARGGSGVHAGHRERQGVRQGQAGAPAGRVEGQGGPGRGARPDRRPGRAGQGGQGRHDGRPAGRARSTRRRSSRR